MSLRDDINIPLVVVLGLATGLIVTVAIIGTQAGYNYATASQLSSNYAEADARGQLRYGEAIWEPQRKSLDQAASWADANKASVRLPIQDAMRIMIDSKGNPGPAAAAPVKQ